MAVGDKEKIEYETKIYIAQNLRKRTLGAKVRKLFAFFSKNDLHSPENDTTYFLKSDCRNCSSASVNANLPSGY